MNVNKNSDEFIVPAKRANNGGAEQSETDPLAESVEERDSTKRNDEESSLRRTQDRTQRRSRGLHGVGEAARKDSTLKFNYHAVPHNSQRLHQFVDEVTKLWLKAFRRRSQKGASSWTWKRMHRFVRRHLPRPRVTHPYPRTRFHDRLKVGAV